MKYYGRSYNDIKSIDKIKTAFIFRTAIKYYLPLVLNSGITAKPVLQKEICLPRLLILNFSRLINPHGLFSTKKDRFQNI